MEARGCVGTWLSNGIGTKWGAKGLGLASLKSVQEQAEKADIDRSFFLPV